MGSHISTQENEIYIPGLGIGGQEKKVANSDHVKISVLNKVSRSVCKIIAQGGMGSGFFASFVLPDGTLFYGLFTNNHVVNPWSMQLHDNFTVQFNNNIIQFVLQEFSYTVTCPFVDFSVFQLSSNQVESLRQLGIDFLSISRNTPRVGCSLFILQHPNGEELQFAPGSISELWGFNILHKVSTDYGSSGSPITNTSGEVIGLHKSRSVVGKCNVGASIREVIRIIISDRNRKIAMRLSLKEPTRPSYLLDESISILERLKLQQISAHHDDWVSPASFLITPIWFKRTFHGWYWTPINPRKSQDQSNYMSVNNSSLAVIGGYWDGEVPAEKNVRIITYLKDHSI